jgi:hypothetical protein
VETRPGKNVGGRLYHSGVHCSNRNSKPSWEFWKPVENSYLTSPAPAGWRSWDIYKHFHQLRLKVILGGPFYSPDTSCLPGGRTSKQEMKDQEILYQRNAVLAVGSQSGTLGTDKKERILGVSALLAENLVTLIKKRYFGMMIQGLCQDICIYWFLNNYKHFCTLSSLSQALWLASHIHITCLFALEFDTPGEIQI